MNGKISSAFVVLLVSVISFLPNMVCAVPPVQFGATTNFNIGGSAVDIATGDFNGDGNLDVVGAVQFSNKLDLVLGNGDGTFAAPILINVIDGPRALAVGDVNNDGILDVLCANASSYAVLLGNGAGGFTNTSFSFNPAFSPGAITLGDFNGDGKLDFAACNYGMVVYSGSGTGTFNFVTNYPVGTPSYSVAVADLNHDNRPDLVTGNYSSSSMSVLLNVGSGVFAAPTNYPGDNSEYHYTVVTGDFNADGHTDLATINQYNSSASVRLNNGNGTFGADVKYPLGYWPRELATADLNGDGILDFVTIPGYTAPMTMLLGNGNGTFGSPLTNSPSLYATAIAAGDFNNDGKPDIATAVSFTNIISIRLNQTTPVLQLSSAELLGATTVQFTNPIPASYTVGNSPLNATLADFNGDGAPDVATPGNVMLNDGTGNFGAVSNFGVYDSPFVASADFNRDGKIDIVTADGGTSPYIWVSLGKGNGSFNTATNFSVGYGPRQIVVGDFNNDTNLDLAVRRMNFPSHVLLGSGNGSFGAPTNVVSATALLSLAAGHFNSDSNLDLVAVDANYGIRLLFGSGNGTFTASTNVVLGGPVGVGDFNNDGNLDIAASKFTTSVLIMLGDGQGLFATNSFFTSISPNAVGPAVADINFDNKPDLLVIAGNGTLSAFLGIGDGTFLIQTNVMASPGATFITAGDLNADGKPDVVTTVGNGATFQRFLNLTPPAQPLPPAIGRRLKIQWPAWPGYAVESSTNLSITNGWVVVTNVPSTNGAARVLTNRFLDDQRFYRLRAP